MPSGSSMCSFKRACEADLGIPLQSGGRTLWHGEDSGSTTKVFLLVEALTGC
jgi:hypothetical protein